MYSEIAKKSFDIWWKNKNLWIIGVLASLSISVSTLSNSNSNSSFSSLGSQFFIFLAIFSLITAIINVVYAVTVAIYADAGQILAYGDIAKGKSVGSVKDIIKSGKKYWLRNFGLILLLGLVIFTIIVIVTIIIVVIALISLAIAGPSASSSSSVGFVVIFLLTVCCISIVAFVFSLIISLAYNIAQRVIILEDKGLIESIKIAFGIMKNNFWKLISAALMLFGIELLLILVLFIPAIILGGIFLAIYTFVMIFVVVLGQSMPLIGALIFTLIEVILSILISILGSFLMSFGQVYWNMVYFKLIEAKNHLVNGEPEKENLESVINDSKPVESQIQS